MRNFYIYFSIFLSMCMYVSAEKVRIGVIDFTAQGGVAAADAQTITELFRSEIANSKVIEMLDRSKMNEMLKEQEFQQSGCTETACAVQLGKILNMQKMVYGVVSKLGDKFYVIVSVVDIETSRVESSVRKQIDGYGGIENAMREIVRDLEKSMAVYATGETLPARRDAAFGGVIRNGIISAALLGTGISTWMIGDATYADGVSLYPEYKSSTSAAFLSSVHDQIESSFNTADILYTISESSLVATGIFLAWGIFDFIMWQNLNAEISRMSIRMRIGAEDNSFALSYTF